MVLCFEELAKAPGQNVSQQLCLPFVDSFTLWVLYVPQPGEADWGVLQQILVCCFFYLGIYLPKHFPALLSSFSVGESDHLPIMPFYKCFLKMAMIKNKIENSMKTLHDAWGFSFFF